MMSALKHIGSGLAAMTAAIGKFRDGAAAHAELNRDGYQEATIIINGRYHPDSLHVAEGIPVRLHFVRREDNPCSERVIFSGLPVDRRLPPFKDTVVEFTPRTPGIFLFTCEWGMYRGKLVVRARGR